MTKDRAEGTLVKIFGQRLCFTFWKITEGNFNLRFAEDRRPKVAITAGKRISRRFFWIQPQFSSFIRLGDIKESKFRIAVEVRSRSQSRCFLLPYHAERSKWWSGPQLRLSWSILSLSFTFPFTERLIRHHGFCPACVHVFVRARLHENDFFFILWSVSPSFFFSLHMPRHKL